MVKAEHAVQAYADGEITAVEARRALGHISFGDLLRLIADAGLKLPIAPTEGREADIARARAWLFPDDEAHA